MDVQPIPHLIIAGRIVIAVAIAAPAIGQAAPTSSGSTAVRGITVRAPSGCIKAHKPPDADRLEPKLVSSFPYDGAAVKPGMIVLRLTYDLPMACPVLLKPDRAFSNPCPYPLAASMVSKDRRTYLAICVVQPGERYGIWLDATGLTGQRLEPRELRFTTSSDELVRVIRDAMAEDPVLAAMPPDGFIPALPMDAQLAPDPSDSRKRTASAKNPSS